MKIHGLTGRTAVPNSASSPIWDARTSLRRILRASLSCWAAARELKGVRPLAPSALKRLLPHILGRNHGSRYYGWSLEQGIFRYFEHPGHLAPEKALEGKYVIQTEELDLSAVQAVEAYKDLSEIERSFRELKDLVEMRPIYHRRPK